MGRGQEEPVRDLRGRAIRTREIVSALAVKDVRFMPGEHDASLDKGEAYREFFGAPYYTFDHKGAHFIALDNVSDPGSPPTSRSARPTIASSCLRTGPCSICSRNGTGPRPTALKRSSF